MAATVPVINLKDHRTEALGDENTELYGSSRLPPTSCWPVWTLFTENNSRTTTSMRRSVSLTGARNGWTATAPSTYSGISVIRRFGRPGEACLLFTKADVRLSKCRSSI